VLRPGQLPDHASTGARHILKEVQQDGAGVDREQGHKDKRSNKTHHTRTLKDQSKGNGYFERWDRPHQEGCPGIGKWLVIHLPDEPVEIKDFTYTSIQEKHYQ